MAKAKQKNKHKVNKKIGLHNYDFDQLRIESSLSLYRRGAYSSAMLIPIRQWCRSYLTNPISQRLVFLLGAAFSSASSTSLCCCREMALSETPSLKLLLPFNGLTPLGRRGWSVFAQTPSAIDQRKRSLEFV